MLVVLKTYTGDAVTKIDSIETRILDLPTIRGHVMSMMTMVLQSVVLVQVRFSDGSIGYGEGASIGGLSYGSESPESIKAAIDSYIAPLLKGADADNVNAAIALIEANVRGNPIARCAAETALWDGLAKRKNCSVAELFGGVVHKSMPVAWTLASGHSQTDVEEALSLIEAKRHNIFKLKIGARSVRDDLAHVAAIKTALGDRASIRVDVNQAWDMQQAGWGLAGLEEMGVDLVEQPIAAGRLASLKMLTDKYKIAVMADEALQGPKDALNCAADRSADVFAVKIAQSGGLKRAREVIAIAEASGIGLYGGTMLETGLGTAAALQVFATVSNVAWGTELFGPLLLTEEILTTPILYKDFQVHLPQGPGIGAVLDADKVAFYDRANPTSAKVRAAR